MSTKNKIVLAFLVASLIAGVAAQFTAPGVPIAPTDFVFMVVSVFLIFWWYRLDAEELSYSRSLLLSLGIVGLSLVFLPYYFFRSRGFRGGVKMTGLLLLVVVASLAMDYAGAFAVYYLLA